MKIGVLGAGLMADALATKWAKAGHEVMISGRTPDKAVELAKKIGRGARVGTFRDAVGFGEVVLLAVRYEGVMETLDLAGAAEGAFEGKIVVDCCNAVEVDYFTIDLRGPDSLAERIQAVARGAKVVKAFNQCQAKVWEMASPVFDGRRLVVPICGSDAESVAIVGALVKDVGCAPADLGPLHFARHVEHMAAIVIKLLWTGSDHYTVFNLISPTQTL